MDRVFVMLGHFLPFYPTNNPKNQNSEKWNLKKAWRYYHFAQVYHNGNHMIYDSWDMKSSRWDFFVILGHFLLYNPSNNAKNQYLLTWKNALHECFKNHDYMLYWSWDMARNGWIFFSFWAIVCPFAFLTVRKNAWRCHHFTHVYQKLWSDNVQFLRYGVRQTDGQMGRWKKWNMEVDAPPNNC